MCAAHVEVMGSRFEEVLGRVGRLRVKFAEGERERDRDRERDSSLHRGIYWV